LIKASTFNWSGLSDKRSKLSPQSFGKQRRLCARQKNRTERSKSARTRLLASC